MLVQWVVLGNKKGVVGTRLPLKMGMKKGKGVPIKQDTFACDFLHCYRGGHLPLKARLTLINRGIF